MKPANSITRAEYEAIRAKAGQPAPRGPRIPRAQKADRTLDGITFDSKSELQQYQELKALQRAGRIRWFLRQPLFDLAGVTYRADFLVVYQHGAIEVMEVKSHGARERPDWPRTKRNIEQVRQLYGIDITLVEK